MDNSNMDRYLGQMLDGRYEILEVIGRGGMAVVYKAKCHLLNRFVAVKILRDDMAADAEFRANFKKEAQAVAMLSHPNIVSVYDVSRTPEVDYIVMELIEGITLKQYMKSKGVLSCRESVHFTTQIAKALAHAHGKGIIHRDIKPQNVMITMDGTVKVADFGIAYLESALEESRDTAVGSVHYISPEQARGLPADARSDLYSLGIVFYEMLTGHLPYTGASAEEIALQHLAGNPTPPRELNPEIPPELEAIVLKTMAVDPEQRYQTAEALLSDLEEFRFGSTAPLPHVGESAETVPSEPLPENVEPLSRAGELTKESYIRRHRRAAKVSLLSGILLALGFAVAVFVFLWNYWLRDLFSDPVKISIPSFVGSELEEVQNNKEFQKLYNFTVIYVVDPDVEAGVIVRQDPQSGKSRTLDGDGIDVSLTVSTGMQMIEVPNVVNTEYRDATQMLQKAGFVVGELEYEASKEITKEYVISSNPAAGEKLPAGATVYLTISTGPTVAKVQMPQLVGLSRWTAVDKIEGANLALGSVTLVESEMAAGTVIWQSVDAYTMVDEHTRVYLQVSSGPKETEPPEETPKPEESDAPADSTEPVAPQMRMTGIGG